jgi:hypothetical protein
VWTPNDTTDAEYNGWGLKEGGILKVLPKLEGFVDNRFAEAAVKRLESAKESANAAVAGSPVSTQSLTSEGASQEPPR